jgi:outer membrane lipoprotein carrier protein
MRTLVVSLTLVALGAAIPAGQATPSPADLAQRIQTHYNTVKDFQSDFTQVYKGGFGKAQPEQRGTVRIKKPGRMRWTYTSPDKQEWCSNGVVIRIYDAVGKTGHETPVPRDTEASFSVLFLMDRGNLVRDFTPSLPGDQPPGEWRLTLSPKRPDADVKSLVLVVDRSTLKLRGLMTTDDQDATNTFQFPNLKENVGLGDKVFDFTFPKGTEIIR